jgi:hypothetical protein
MLPETPPGPDQVTGALAVTVGIFACLLGWFAVVGYCTGQLLRWATAS